MAGLDAALRELWDERHPERPPWLPNLLLKHVTRTIVKGVVSRSVDTAAMRAGPGRSGRERLRTVLDAGGWAEVRAQCEAADGYMAAAWAHFRELPVEQRPTTIRESVSEKACTDVRAVYAREGPAAGAERLAVAVTAARERYQRAEIARTPLVRGLIDDEDEFVARYRDRYEAAWRARDTTAHDAHPPWRIGLGSLPRPPLGRAAPRGRATDDRLDWHLGTDRPVFSRYRHHISKRGADRLGATADALGVSSDRHMWTRLAGAGPDGPARTEVDRAAEPLGLRFAEHRWLLEMLRHGVLRGDVEVSQRGPKAVVAPRRAVLDRWCAAHPVLPTAEDDDLIDALGHGCASAAVRYRSVTTLAAARTGRAVRAVRAGELAADAASDRPTDAGGQADWTDQVELGVLRRMWQECLHCEMEWDTPLTPATLPRLVGGVFGAHLSELAARPIVRPEPPAARDDWIRQQDTLLALDGDLQELAGSARTDGAGWRDRYADALRRADPDAPPGHLLDSEEFRLLVARVWSEHDRGEPDDPDDTDDGTDDEGGA